MSPAGPLLVALVGQIAQAPPASSPPAGTAQAAEGGTPAVDPAPPIVTTAIEPGEVRVGERIRFTVTVVHDGARAFRLPDTLPFGDFELVDREVIPPGPPAADGRVTAGFVLTLALFEPGRHLVPDLELPYVDAQGREFAATAQGGLVVCKSVIANESAPELKPPPGPVPVIVEDRRPLYVAGVLGLMAISALIAFGVARVFRGRRPAAPPPPPVPPEVVALGRLQTLRARNLPRQGMVKEFYLELSHILREYFEGRYAIPALEMTTEEVVVHLTDARLRGVRRSTVERFLGESDLVKFARHLPDDDDIADIFLSCEEIILRTTPEPAPREAAAPGPRDAA